MRIWPGQPYPLGATWNGEGVNFALFSENATGVQLCLFNHPEASEEIARIPLRERTNNVWHVYLPDVRPPDSCTATGSTGRTNPRRGIASTPPSCSSTRTRRRSHTR